MKKGEERKGERKNRQAKKESERRPTGKEMLDYERKHEEEFTKRMLEERNRKGRKKIRGAGERIKQQIALDPEERARFARTGRSRSC